MLFVIVLVQGKEQEVKKEVLEEIYQQIKISKNQRELLQELERKLDAISKQLENL